MTGVPSHRHLRTLTPDEQQAIAHVINSRIDWAEVDQELAPLGISFADVVIPELIAITHAKARGTADDSKVRNHQPPASDSKSDD